MSEEKKASWGKTYEAAAAQEPKASNAPRIETPEAAVVQAAPLDGDADAGRSDGGGADKGARARNQHVLPGILGKQIRAAYGELLNAPVPDAIAELVKRLDRQQAEKSTKPKPHDEEGGQ